MKIELHSRQTVPQQCHEGANNLYESSCRYQYLQDNPKWHKAAQTMEILRELVDDRIIDHPPQSPDFNIMEDLWSYLDRKVKGARIKTIKGLKKRLTQEWDKLPWSYIRSSVKSMRRRLAECEELQGGRTDY